MKPRHVCAMTVLRHAAVPHLVGSWLWGKEASNVSAWRMDLHFPCGDFMF